MKKLYESVRAFGVALEFRGIISVTKGENRSGGANQSRIQPTYMMSAERLIRTGDRRVFLLLRQPCSRKPQGSLGGS